MAADRIRRHCRSGRLHFTGENIRSGASGLTTTDRGGSCGSNVGTFTFTKAESLELANRFGGGQGHQAISGSIGGCAFRRARSEEQPSELKSLMRNPYAA